jgi:lipoprotein-anchoring transpeptidase ErfK/SrfK
MLRVAAALVAACALAGTASPAVEPTHAIAAGVRAMSVSIGGLSPNRAGDTISAAFGRPLRIVAHGKTVAVDPEQLGAELDVDPMIRTALAATAGTHVNAQLHVPQTSIAAYVRKLATRFNRLPRPAVVTGANAQGPIIRPAKPGLAVQQRTMVAALRQELSSGSRAPLVLVTAPVAAKRTADMLGAVIVVNRHANTLKLYSSTRLVRTLHVATGQSIYPTPHGVFDIIDKQKNPWWYPPTQDDWAQGLKPVPPGPNNPLGTRWMGINVPGVGIHGTDEPTSIGYSESHGCVRMHIPDAEWLFGHVKVGTPVVIV